MTQQEDGWPLGLQPLNVRVGLVRNRDLNGSVSFNTLITGSPTSSTDSSSDLDTESTGSFFHDKSITLGSLIGVSSILDLSHRSTRGGRTSETSRDRKICKNNRPKTWLFSLCSKLSTDAVSTDNTTPSLKQFLEEERRTASMYRANPSPIPYGPDDFSHPVLCPDNSLFLSGHIAPHDHQSSSWVFSDGETRTNRGLFDHGNGYGAPLLLSCLCGPLTH